MVGLEAAMLASAAIAFTMFLWLLVYGRDHSRVDFVAYADAHGWDHRRDAPRHLVSRAAEMTDGVRRTAPHGPYFAGPSGAGPFQVVGIHSAGMGGRGDDRTWTGDRTFVHMRTATTSPGLCFGPREVYTAETDDAAADAVGHSGFLRRYNVKANDASFAASALDYEACELLVQPNRGVMGAWDEHDLYLVFPVRPGTMGGYETLLRYAVALTRRLERHDGHALPLATRPAAHPVPEIGAAPVDRKRAIPA